MGNAGDDFWVQYTEYMQDNILFEPTLDDPAYEIPCNKDIEDDSIRYRTVKGESNPSIDSILQDIKTEKAFDTCESSEDHRDDYMSHFENTDGCISEGLDFKQEQKVSTVVSKSLDDIHADIAKSCEVSSIGIDVKSTQSIICNFCNTLFSSTEELSVHQSSSSECAEHKYKCLHCDVEFRKEGRLEKHMTTHKIKRCLICGKEFTRLAHLSTHLLIHNNIRPWSCKNCSRSFTDKSSLKKHQLVHTGLREYECDICNKTFQRAQHLLRHKEAHEGVKNFQCSICGRSFQLKHSLKIHMNTHSGEKPYKCTVCLRPFADKYALKRHGSVHNKMLDGKRTCLNN